MEDVCVVGLGAVGVFYAHLLEKSGKVRVTAVCRSNHSILRDSGVHVVSTVPQLDAQWKPYRAVSSCADAADRTYRFVVCCFKALPDVITTPDLIAPLLSRAQTFVLIQNGVGIERDLQRAVPAATIISANAWVDATTLDGGKRVEQTGDARLTTGVHRTEVTNADVSTAEASLQLFGNILRAAGTKVTEMENIEASRWRKVLWNASISTVCTLTRSGVAETLREPNAASSEAAFRAVMREVLATAEAAGISAPNLNDEAIETIVGDTLANYGPQASSPSAFRPSMLVDLEAGRPIEVEAIVGGIVQTARSHGVATPHLDFIYAALKVIQQGLIARRSHR